MTPSKGPDWAQAVRRVGSAAETHSLLGSASAAHQHRIGTWPALTGAGQHWNLVREDSLSKEKWHRIQKTWRGSWPVPPARLQGGGPQVPK